MSTGPDPLAAGGRLARPDGGLRDRRPCGAYRPRHDPLAAGKGLLGRGGGGPGGGTRTLAGPFTLPEGTLR